VSKTSAGARLSAALLGGSLAAWLGKVWPMLALTFIFIVLDYITGMLSAGINRRLSSAKGAVGILKKTASLALLTLGLVLDAAIVYFAEAGFDTSLGFRLPFGLIICVWIVINEAISITENLYSCGVKVPGFLLKALKITADKIDKKTEEGKNGG
jgi:toxin secretion/phage lysis holin